MCLMPMEARVNESTSPQNSLIYSTLMAYSFLQDTRNQPGAGCQFPFTTRDPLEEVRGKELPPTILFQATPSSIRSLYSKFTISHNMR